MKLENVKSAEKNTAQTNTHQQNIADLNAVRWVGIESIVSKGTEPVYNMEVDEYHNYSVSGGIIVHNCMDAVRYFVQTVGIWRKKEKRNVPWLL